MGVKKDEYDNYEEEEDYVAPSSKRQRSDDDEGNNKNDGMTAMTDYENTPIRTSSLASRTLKLTGHSGSVYGLAYCPRGELMVSCSFDKTCLLWNHQSCDYENLNVLSGHKNAVLDVQFLQENTVVTASADTTCAAYDVNTGQRLQRGLSHDGIVNALSTSPSDRNVWATASDDGHARLWDIRVKGRRHGPVLTVFATANDTDDYHSYDNHQAVPITAIAYSAENHMLYTGGIDNHIHVFDTRAVSSSDTTSAVTNSCNKVMSMIGHEDTISCLSLHPQHENQILSYSMDGTLRTWDVSPFSQGKSKRQLKTFYGSKVNADKGLLKCRWNSDGTMVTAGSSDKAVHIWDELTTQSLYTLPGHTGCVNSVIFHPTENVIASASSDKTIFVGELG